jgi:predicted hydrocarbon binding protein
MVKSPSSTLKMQDRRTEQVSMQDAGRAMLTGQEMTDLSFQMITEFSFSALRNLVDLAGSEAAIELNRPYWDHAGQAAALILIKNLGLKQGTHRDVESMYGFITQVMRIEGEFVEVEGTDWQEMRIHSCPFESGPPEFCFLLDHVVSSAMTEVIMPGTEAVAVQMRTRGDPYCVILNRPIGSRKERPEGRVRSLPGPSPLPISREDADSWAVQYIAEHWVMITRAMMGFERAEEVLQAQLRSMRELGLAYGLRLKEGASHAHQGAQGIASLLEFSNLLLHQEGESRAIGPDSVACEIVSCPFQHAPPALCAQYEAFLEGMGEAVDQACCVRYERMMTKGDRTCRWVVQRKEAEALPSKPEAGITSSAEEPLKVLALRLARGEISEEEFERKRRLLKGP